VTSHKS